MSRFQDRIAAIATGSGQHEYSVERLFVFHEYCQRVSALRVFFAIGFYALPALVLLVIIEVVPLQDPREGWSANGMYWARISWTAAMSSVLFLNQAPTFIPEVVMTPMNKIALTVSAAAAFGGTIVVLAKYWKFPVPFALTLGSGPFFAAFSLIAVLIMGKSNKAQLRRFQHFMLTNSIQGSMIAVYPAYNAVFLPLDGIPHLALVVLLPIVKLSYKHMLAKPKMWDDDLLPSVFACVDIFDAMYMTKCMQSAGTVTVGVVIVAVDLAQNLMAIRKLSKQTQCLRRDFQTHQLLPQVLAQLEKSHRLNSSFMRSEVTTHSRLALSASSQSELQSLEPSQIQSGDTIKQEMALPVKTASTHRIYPSNVLQRENSQPSRIVKEAMRQLHAIEEVAAVEYIEAIVPFAYATYLAIMVHLPNAKY